MKTSVILGVAQMLLGILLKGLNALYFKRWAEFVFEFITQLIALVCLFGFMDYLIIVKWTTNWVDTAKAPGVIASMIAVMTGSKDKGVPIIPNQTSVFQSLLLVAIACIPLMLFIRPIMIYRQNQAKK